MMSTTLLLLSTSIGAGVAIPWPELLNKRSVQRIVQVRQVRPVKSSKGQIRQQNRNQLFDTSFRVTKTTKIAKPEKTNNTQK